MKYEALHSAAEILNKNNHLVKKKSFRSMRSSVSNFLRTEGNFVGFL